MTEQLTLILTDFEGPLDLLLHLINQTKIFMIFQLLKSPRNI